MNKKYKKYILYVRIGLSFVREVEKKWYMVRLLEVEHRLYERKHIIVK